MVHLAYLEEQTNSRVRRRYHLFEFWFHIAWVHKKQAVKLFHDSLVTGTGVTGAGVIFAGAGVAGAGVTGEGVTGAGVTEAGVTGAGVTGAGVIIDFCFLSRTTASSSAARGTLHA
jgi:hypothetical protein